MAEKLKTIELRTLKTGYELKANGRDYMYYNIQDLCAGFIKHVQQGIEPYIDEHYIKALEDKVEEMRNLYERALTERDLAIKEKREQYNLRVEDGKEKTELRKKVEKLDTQIRQMEEVIKMAEKKVEVYKNKNADLRKKVKDFKEKISSFTKTLK